MLPIKKILCPTDFSEPSLAALDTACELARHFNAELHILHVVPLAPPFPADVLAAPGAHLSDKERMTEAHRQIEGLIEKHVPAEVRVLLAVRMGHAAHEIVCAANEDAADIIVMGTHGATGWRHLAFGSVAEKVVRMARCPVLTEHGGTAPEHDDEANASTTEPLSQKL